ncbi:unnamed protein product [Polarella glacialis]|uniref:Uncharacterized protein n=1 Tax=Polarella glacialis TaxID=89957 RepID=A0A813KU66_POLGL|nr:unnamed protein product [Polarella glacialis]
MEPSPETSLGFLEPRARRRDGGRTAGWRIHGRSRPSQRCVARQLLLGVALLLLGKVPSFSFANFIGVCSLDQRLFRTTTVVRHAGGGFSYGKPKGEARGFGDDSLQPEETSKKGEDDQKEADDEEDEAAARRARSIVKDRREGKAGALSTTKLKDLRDSTLALRQKREAELDEYEEGRAILAKYGPKAGVMPEPVAKRAAKRGMVLGGAFYGTMLAVVGFGIFLYKSQELIIPPTLMAFVTLALLALAIAGSSYGMMSASWDEDREGSILGTEEFAKNVKVIGEGFRKLSMQDEYDKAVGARNQRRKLLEAKEQKKTELLNKSLGWGPPFTSSLAIIMAASTDPARMLGLRPKGRRPASARWMAAVAAVSVVAAQISLAGSPSFLAAVSGRRASALGLSLLVAEALTPAAWAKKRPEGQNRPELLPSTDGDSTPVIDCARILSARQLRELAVQIADIERNSKVRLRVLTQTFPNTPGMAIKDYWKVDSRTVIYVHDTGGLGETAVVNFNAGLDAENLQPRSWWRQLQNKFGNRFYIAEHGDTETVTDVVSALHSAFASTERFARRDGCSSLLPWLEQGIQLQFVERTLRKPPDRVAVATPARSPVRAAKEVAEDVEHDGRLFIEWFLLPPGVTLSRAASSMMFFVMIYCFVWVAWYFAVGGDVCGEHRRAADLAEAEVTRLTQSLQSLRGASGRA